MYRQLIVDAAEALFAARGIDDSRMEAVAAEAGLSLGTLYSVFDGKAAIVRAVHETRLRDVLRQATEAARGLTTPLEMLLAGVRTYVRFFLTHPNYLRMHLRAGTSWALVSASLGTPEQSDAWHEGVAMQAALFARGNADGTFHAGDPMVQTKMMIAMQQVQLASWVEGGMTRAPDVVVREIEEQVRRSFCVAR
jgi:AcrR family transcriptional regulator